MSYTIPETITRLQATAFASNAELKNIRRSEIIRMTAQQMAEQALRKILEDCISSDEYLGYSGQTLRLDVYVLSENDLTKIIRDARQQGEQDALRWRT